ncbi:CdaR family protein [Bellilinea sp.]|mgnify:FL=1|jgi:YbbR domain-containing protein|uniref:YbbR-like domain-containing protein n=1 Tax=Bellilinea caldifistulae TaxID=360411 RepID=A0A7C4KXM5_9CHLR|nr:CdaR family protein [Bellilinea sp.]
MIEVLRRLLRLLPSLITAFILALAVWISAVSSSDPLSERTYPNPLPIEIIGQDPGLVITSSIPSSVTVVLSAPQSIWNQLNTETGAVRAFLDLSGLEAGSHSVPVRVQISVRPVRKIAQSPQSITVTLERLASKEFPIRVVTRGSPAVGYTADSPTLSQTSVTISGPESQVNRVAEVQAIIDLSQATETITRTVNLVAVDANDNPVNGLSLLPDRVTIRQNISQRFGYRNVVIKVVVLGQVASGYRLTNISVFPPAVTVFSADPQIVSDLPGFIETEPLNINGLKDDLDISLSLNLPPGVSVVGDQTEVLVRVGIAAIESSLTLPSIPVEITGLQPGLSAVISPETITVIISGPVALLDRLRATDVRAVVDLTALTEGSYQIEPEVEILIAELKPESLLPESVEVIITRTTRSTSGTITP